MRRQCVPGSRVYKSARAHYQQLRDKKFEESQFQRQLTIRLTYMAEKIRACGPKLRVAFQGHLDSLPDLLLAEHLITDKNVSELKTTAQAEPSRAFENVGVYQKQGDTQSRRL